jgi:hypothetical protein
MVVSPASVCFREPKDVDVKALDALKVVFVVLESGRVSETFNVLEKETNGASGFLGDGITVGY